MACNYDGKCPYDNECDGCLHYIPEKPKTYRKTGIKAKDKREYKREYRRMIQREKLEVEMKSAGIGGGFSGK